MAIQLLISYKGSEGGNGGPSVALEGDNGGQSVAPEGGNGGPSVAPEEGNGGQSAAPEGGNEGETKAPEGGNEGGECTYPEGHTMNLYSGPVSKILLNEQIILNIFIGRRVRVGAHVQRT